MSRRVVVTGIGIISPLGNTVNANWDALVGGAGGIGPIRSFPGDVSPARCAGEIKEFKPGAYRIKQKSLKVMNRTIQYALAATCLALEDARAHEKAYRPESFGLALGVDGIQYTVEEFLLASCEAVGNDMRNYIDGADDMHSDPITTKDPDLAVHPLWPLSVLPNMALCHMAIQHFLQGPNVVYSSIDVGGPQAIAEGFQAIRQGECDFYVAGASYALNSMSVLSMSSWGLLSEQHQECRPFDVSRDGCVLGEGAAMLVLEDSRQAEARGAPIYAELLGYGSLFDGRVSEPGRSEWPAMAQCTQQALDRAGLAPAQIAYVNADGKGAVEADLMESRALEHVFGHGNPSVPISTSKPLTGHMLSASGAFEAASTVLSVAKQCIPPTLNCGRPDPLCAVNLVAGNALKQDMQYAISNTFGLTGEHATLVFGRC